jgi:rhodanese-related sulfurtransferase
VIAIGSEVASETQENTDMRNRSMTLIALLAALVLAGALPAMAGDGSSAWDKVSALLGSKHEDENFKLIHVADLAALKADPNSHVVVLDANIEPTRDKYGVIPGALLLPSYDNYDIATELPPAKNAKLVFYCANTRCMASHGAALRAVAAGYTDVSVMADGIMGWDAAGQPHEDAASGQHAAM